jgi:colicin import membrane protein
MSGKYLVKMRYSVVFLNIVFYTRRQSSYYEEQEAMLKNKEWEEEKRQQEAEKQIQENQRREMILKKREIEKEEFYRRLEESQKKFVEAQDNLEQVIQRQQIEKKVSFNDVVSAKVELTGYFKIRFPQVINTAEEKQKEADKHKNVQKALAEMERREEEVKGLHDRDQLIKEEEARKRKEEMKQQIKGKILSSNR